MGDGIHIQTNLSQATKVARAQQGQQVHPENGDDAVQKKLQEGSEARLNAVKKSAEAEKARIGEKERERRRRRRRQRSDEDEEDQGPGGRVDIKV